VEKQGKLEYSVDQKTFEKQGWVIRPKDIKLGDFIGGGDFASKYKLCAVCSSNSTVISTFCKEMKTTHQHIPWKQALTINLYNITVLFLVEQYMCVCVCEREVHFS